MTIRQEFHSQGLRCDADQLFESLREWAICNGLITEVKLFGSRVRGKSKTGEIVRKDSDIDICIDFEKDPNDSSCLTTYTCEVGAWKEQIRKALNLREEIGISIVWRQDLSDDFDMADTLQVYP